MKRERVWPVIIVVGLVVLESVTPRPGLGQEDGSFHLTPRFGRIDVLRGTFGTLSREGVSMRGAIDLGNGATAGVALDMRLPADWMEFRLTADRSLGVELERPGVTVTTVDDTPVLASTFPRESVGTGIGVRRWTFGGDLLLLYPAPAWRVRPFAAVGAGFHWYRYGEPDDEAGEFLVTGSDDPWDGVFRFGVGADVRVLGQVVRSEFSFQQGGRARAGDHQETHVTVGLRVPLR